MNKVNTFGQARTYYGGVIRLCYLAVFSPCTFTVVTPLRNDFCVAGLLRSGLAIEVLSSTAGARCTVNLIARHLI